MENAIDDVGVEELKVFLRAKLDEHSLTGAAEGVTRLALDRGTSVLTAKQRYVLQGVIDKYAGLRCRLCQRDIPLDEAITALDINEGYCGDCANATTKD